MSTHTAIESLRPHAKRSGVMAGFARRALIRRLAALKHGRLDLIEGHERHTLGSPGELDASLHVLHPSFYTRLAYGGSVAAGETYMDGCWRSEDLVTLVRLLVRNRDLLDAMDGGAMPIARALDKLDHHKRSNSLEGSRRNVRAHYDLGNALFATFLDREMMYSSAIFDDEYQDLEAASLTKLERIATKLELNERDHLLEIGTGWGGLALHAARTRGCRVTTATISEEQYRHARARVAEAGLTERVTVVNQDYRAIEGTFTKLVSIEMVEAVGDEHLDGYFRICDRHLAPGGLFLLQAITIEDHRYRRALEAVDFIKKHIFPGSFIPCVSRLVQASAAGTELCLVNLEDIGLDYARTLEEWRRRFLGGREHVRKLGFDERFMRAWEFYLCYCEGGFRERSISDVQMLFAKAGYRGRPWRGRSQ